MGRHSRLARLLKRAQIRGRVDEILRAAAQSTAEQVSFDQVRVLNRLDALSRAAEKAGQYSAAARCEELIGRTRGIFLNRSENIVRWDGDLNSLDDAQLETMASFFEAIAAGARPLPQIAAPVIDVQAERPTE
jgi:hypothetical protein